MDFISELKWRGMLHDMTPGLEELLTKGNATGYVGFDPTADSLHIGNLVPVMMLVHWHCLLYTSPSPRDYAASRMPSSA